MTVLSANLKRFRGARNMTQEQAAEALGVSTQTVSRWECGTTLPDAAILPRIARLYCITIDDLYKQTSVAYSSYAQRLFSIYEDSRQPEDFLQADAEFRRLLKSGDHTQEDLLSYGILHQYMMGECMKNASAIFHRILQNGPDEDPFLYWKAKRQQGYFLHEIGRNSETIAEFLPLVQSGSRELNHWLCLIQAYQLSGDHPAAWDWAQKAQTQFPENAMLHIYCGSLCKAMKQYETAFRHWNRALELEPEWMDAAYAMGECYEELGDYESACAVWCRITGELTQRGYEAEAIYPRAMANRCKEKISAS